MTAPARRHPRRRLRLILQVLTLAAFSATLILRGGWAGLAAALAALALAALVVAAMRRSQARRPRRPWRSR